MASGTNAVRDWVSRTAQDIHPSNSGPIFYAVLIVSVVFLANLVAVVWIFVERVQEDSRAEQCFAALAPGADLTDCDFANAHLRGADLQGANLTSANLNEANLAGANLSGADLTGADLTDANLSSTNLTGVVWSGTTCPDGSKASLTPCRPR